MAQARRLGAPRGGSGLAPWGMPQVPRAKALYALTNFTAANYLATAAGGGEAGVASGFGGAELVRLRSLGSTTQVIAERLGAGNTGYTLYLTSGNVLTLEIKDGTGASKSSFQQLVASDVGRILLVAWQHAGAAIRMLVFRDVSPSGDVAITGYSVPTNATTIGARSAGTFPALTVDWLSGMTWLGTPTAAQLRTSLFDATRVLGDLPLSIDGGTVTHHSSLKRQLAKAGAPVVDGQAAPAQLDDTVTGATVDALAKVGSPLVRVIDPSVDGRTTKGVLGFGAAAYLETPFVAPGTFGSATGFHVRIPVIFSSLSGIEILVGNSDAGATYGWTISRDGTTLRANVGNSTTGTLFSSRTLTNADLGVVHFVELNFSGSHVTLIYDGVASASVATTWSTSSARVIKVGALNQNTGVWFAATASIFGLAYGNSAVTIAESQQAYSDFAKTGRVPSTAGKTEYLWDFTLDAAANNGELPSQFQDRIGTVSLARVDPVTRVGSPSGLRIASGSGYVSSGLAGAASGFWFSEYGSYDVLSTLGTLGGKRTTSPQAGYDIAIGGTTVYFECSNGAGGIPNASGTIAVGAARRVITGVMTGSALRLYLDGVQLGSDVACAGFTPAGGLFRIGGNADGAMPQPGFAWCGDAGGFGVPSHAEVAAHAAATLSAGSMQAIPGKTSMLHDPTLDAAVTVPSRILERVTATDNLTRYGAGLQVAQRVERVWSYETSPIMKAGQASTGNRWEQPANSEWVGKTSFFAGLMFRCRGATSGRIAAFSNGAAAAGWQLNLVGGTTLQFIVADAGGANRTAPTIVVSADSKVRCVLGVLDGVAGFVRGYQNRAQAGGGTSCTGFATSAAFGVSLGAFWGGGTPQPDADILGFVYGFTVPTLAEFQAWEDACMATEDIAALGTGSAHMYSAKRGLDKDLIGTLDAPAVGSPSIVDIYGRAFAR